MQSAIQIDSVFKHPSPRTRTEECDENLITFVNHFIRRKYVKTCPQVPEKNGQKQKKILQNSIFETLVANILSAEI